MTRISFMTTRFIIFLYKSAYYVSTRNMIVIMGGQNFQFTAIWVLLLAPRISEIQFDYFSYDCHRFSNALKKILNLKGPQTNETTS